MQYLNGNKTQDKNDSGISFDVISEINDLLDGINSKNIETPFCSYSNQNTGNAEHDFMQYLNVPKLKQKASKISSVKTLKSKY